MSPKLQQEFMAAIMPIIVSVIPRTVTPLAGEDREDLVQDCLADACRAVESLERRGRPVIPASVAYYAIQRMKTGRRTTVSGRTDVMSPGCQLDGRSEFVEIDAPVSTGVDDSPTDLHEALADDHDDPATEACRRLDWSKFYAGLGDQHRRVLTDTAQGYRGSETADALNVSSPRITKIKREIAHGAAALWGPTILADAAADPQWRRDLAQRRH